MNRAFLIIRTLVISIVTAFKKETRTASSTTNTSNTKILTDGQYTGTTTIEKMYYNKNWHFISSSSTSSTQPDLNEAILGKSEMEFQF
jgi:hypothetical protein